VWELLTDGEIPYCCIGSNEEVGKGVIDGSLRLKMPDACPVELWSIVVKCWAERPEDRPTFRALVAALEGLWHAQLAIDDDYDAWAALARRVLTSKYLHLELGVFRCL
jgi:hypothetical protein